MKKLIPLLFVIAVTLLALSSFATAQPQDTAKEEKPTFYHLTPGIYVNGWPRFTIHYPKDWIERRPDHVTGLFAVRPSEAPQGGGGFGVFAGVNALPLDKFVDIVVPTWKIAAKDVTVVNDKPSQLRDGTPAREVELQMILNGRPFNFLGVATKKGDLWINANVTSFEGKIGEDRRAIPYSLQYEPVKDEPVKVPPDIMEFLDKWCNDIVSHDIAKVMTHYSEKFLDSGMRKGGVEKHFWKLLIGFITSLEVVITELVPAGDKSYLAGFMIVNWGKDVLRGTSIIKENGEWKWYGNQRDVSP
jgi:hypothetical protein